MTVVIAPPLVGCVVWNCSICSPLASSSSINKLQVMQNAAFRTATGYSQDTNIQHLHDETLIFPIHDHTRSRYTAPCVTIQTENITSTTSLTQIYNIRQHFKSKKTLTTAATQQTFSQTPTQSLQQTYKQTCAIYTHLLSLGI